MTTSLFTYGTLEIPDVIEAVTGRRFSATAAVLEDHARYLLRGETYPGVVWEGGARVTGMLYDGIDDASLALIDLFEGDVYRREPVRVSTDARAGLRAFAYLVPSDRRALLSDRRWDRARFEERHLADFLAGCRDFHDHHHRRLEAARNPG
jgi:gamma-glutamylcyclotransferase (GGCT)/AIG2-like uncharacterized protein YtfP